MDCIILAVFSDRFPVTVELIGIDTEQGMELMLIVDTENSEMVKTQTLPRVFHALEVIRYAYLDMPISHGLCENIVDIVHCKILPIIAFDSNIAEQLESLPMPVSIIATQSK